MNCPDSYQNSKLDISNCKTKALYTILSYLGLKRRFWEKKWSYIMQGSKLPTTLAKHQELFFDPPYHQFSLNMTILRGSYYNSQLSPLWIDQGHPLYRKKKTFPFPSVISLQLIWENMSNCNDFWHCKYSHIQMLHKNASPRR